MRHKYRYNSLLTSSTLEENDSSVISLGLEEEPVTKRARVSADIETGIQTMNLSLPSTNDTTKNATIQEEEQVKEDDEEKQKEEYHIPELVKAQRALVSKFILQRIYCQRGNYQEPSKSLIDSKIENLIRGSLQKAMKEHRQQQQNLDVVMSERDGDSDNTNCANTYNACWEDGHDDDDDDTTFMDTS